MGYATINTYVFVNVQQPDDVKLVDAFDVPSAWKKLGDWLEEVFGVEMREELLALFRLAEHTVIK